MKQISTRIDLSMKLGVIFKTEKFYASVTIPKRVCLKWLFGYILITICVPQC